MQTTNAPKKPTRERRLVKIDAAIFAGMAIDHGRDNDEQTVTLLCRDRRGAAYHLVFDDVQFARLKLFVLHTLTRAEAEQDRETKRLEKLAAVD